MKYRVGIIFCILPALALAQESPAARPSPMTAVAAHYKDCYIKIVYGRPQKRGREVFGKLVPYGQVWRTGANEATELTVTRDIRIGGNDLKGGTYSIFTIPEKNTWTLIINSDLGLWGAYNYNPKMDVLRIDVPVAEIPDMVFDAFTISLDQKNDKADLVMSWDKTRVTIPIQFLEPKL